MTKDRDELRKTLNELDTALEMACLQVQAVPIMVFMVFPIWCLGAPISWALHKLLDSKETI